MVRTSPVTQSEINRKQAIAEGRKTYMGAPCKNGHSGERHVRKPGACVECQKIRILKWAKKNPDKLKASRDRNRDTIRAKERQYRADNPEREKARAAKYYKLNQERIAAKRAADRLANPEKHKIRSLRSAAQRKKKSGISAYFVRMAKRRRVIRAGAEGSHTFKEILALLKKQGYVCAACPTKIHKKRHADHIIPLSKGGSDFISNIQMLCPSCNLSKGSKTMDEWLAHKARFSCKEVA